MQQSNIILLFFQAYARQAKGNKWSELSSTQRSYLLARLIDTEIVEPMQVLSINHLKPQNPKKYYFLWQFDIFYSITDDGSLYQVSCI